MQARLRFANSTASDKSQPSPLACNGPHVVFAELAFRVTIFGFIGMAVLEPTLLSGITRRSAFLRLWTLGLVGAAIIAAEPLPANLIAGSHVPELAFRSFTFINTGLMLAAMIGLGTVAAREVGLYSVFAPQLPTGLRLRRNTLHWAQAAIIVGIVVALAQFAFDFAFWRLVPSAQLLALRHAAQLSAASPLSRLLFQALTDELMLRWGLMSGVLWVLALLFHQKSKPRPSLVWAAIVIVSILSALGEVPALINMLAIDPASVIILRATIVSAVAGIGYGWLYWKYGLEAAILAHVLAQAGLVALEGSALL